MYRVTATFALSLLLFWGNNYHNNNNVNNHNNNHRGTSVLLVSGFVVVPDTIISPAARRTTTTTTPHDSLMFLRNNNDHQLNQRTEPRKRQRQQKKTSTSLRAQNTDKEVEEEVRLNMYQSRRKQIRSTLKAAESLRNFRLQNDLAPEIDEDTGEPVKDNQLVFWLTGVVVAVGAVVLRLGGRAAFMSVLGLDFASENPELKEQLQVILDATDSMDYVTKLGAFTLAWTIVKVACFDPLGIALALSSGILFGGVLQGALVSAGAATVGSLVAFSTSKSDALPFRQKALEIIEEYPTLRGIEKVVAEDGFKAILTLRLAPVLPIPIGMYNYIYGVTNVPVLDFMAGIFLGSLKPYLLDSYLGYFGKSIMDGSISEGNTTQDFLLLVVLGVSVVLGVFASQLANETWDSVLKEIEADEEAKKAEAVANGEVVEIDDGITREVLGFQLPQWMIGYQLAMQQATYRMEDLTYAEHEAKVWNYTTTPAAANDEMLLLPDNLNPAKALDSPEMVGRYGGIDIVKSLCDSVVTTPVLFDVFLRYSDPLFDEETEREYMAKQISGRNIENRDNNSGWKTTQERNDATATVAAATVALMTTTTTSGDGATLLSKKEELLQRLDNIEASSKTQLQKLEERLKEENL